MTRAILIAAALATLAACQTGPAYNYAQPVYVPQPYPYPVGGYYGGFGARQLEMCTRHGAVILCN